MEKITQSDWDAIPACNKSVWETERTDLPNWERDRHLYMGKRTFMRGSCLSIEGLSFEIVPDSPAATLLKTDTWIAAKACGLKLYQGYGALMLNGEPWNPLEDAKASRMIETLLGFSFFLDQDNDVTTVYQFGVEVAKESLSAHQGDPEKAHRAAVFRAAVKIGSMVKVGDDALAFINTETGSVPVKVMKDVTAEDWAQASTPQLEGEKLYEVRHSDPRWKGQFTVIAARHLNPA